MAVARRLEGSGVVAADCLPQKPSWAVDVVGARSAPESLLADGDSAAGSRGTCLRLACSARGGGQSRQQGASWVLEKLGQPPAVHSGRAQPWVCFCLDIRLDSLPHREETVLGPLPAPETGVSWAQDRKCTGSEQDFLCSTPGGLLKGHSCLSHIQNIISINLDVGWRSLGF